MANRTPAEKSLPHESVRRNRAVLADVPENNEYRDSLYLFACHVEWRTNQNSVEYKELLAAIDDHDVFIRALAEELISRKSRGCAGHTEIETR
jgi:hypothetical protein